MMDTSPTPATGHSPATGRSPDSTSARARRPVLGLSVPALIGLALLGVPRVVLHDLGIIAEGTPVNSVFVVVPVLVWLVVVLWTRVPRPFLTLLVVGAFYGFFLMLCHQLLWNVGLDGTPRLGGNLAGLPPLAQSVIFRAFAAVSSMVTGTLVGAATGLVAWLVKLLIDRVR